MCYIYSKYEHSADHYSCKWPTAASKLPTHRNQARRQQRDEESTFNAMMTNNQRDDESINAAITNQ
jgi:hypothetical protein